MSRLQRKSLQDHIIKVCRINEDSLHFTDEEKQQQKVGSALTLATRGPEELT